MSDRRVTYCTKNPYVLESQTTNTAVLHPDAYKMGQILTSLHPVALRVLFYAVANLQPDGRVELKPRELGLLMRTHSTYAGRGIKELVKYNFLTRQTLYDYWLNPDVARPIAIVLS